MCEASSRSPAERDRQLENPLLMEIVRQHRMTQEEFVTRIEDCPAGTDRVAILDSLQELKRSGLVRFSGDVSNQPLPRCGRQRSSRWFEGRPPNGRFIERNGGDLIPRGDGACIRLSAGCGRIDGRGWVPWPWGYRSAHRQALDSSAARTESPCLLECVRILEPRGTERSRLRLALRARLRGQEIGLSEASFSFAGG